MQIYNKVPFLQGPKEKKKEISKEVVE